MKTKTVSAAPFTETTRPPMPHGTSQEDPIRGGPPMREVLNEARIQQGWTAGDYERDLAQVNNGYEGGPIAMFVSRQQVKIGLNRFTLGEASHIRAHAGCALSRSVLSTGVGIDDVQGRRWHLYSKSRRTIVLQRCNTVYQLRPAQVMRAFIEAFDQA